MSVISVILWLCGSDVPFQIPSHTTTWSHRR